MRAACTAAWLKHIVSFAFAQCADVYEYLESDSSSSYIYEGCRGERLSLHRLDLALHGCSIGDGRRALRVPHQRLPQHLQSRSRSSGKLDFHIEQWLCCHTLHVARLGVQTASAPFAAPATERHYEAQSGMAAASSTLGGCRLGTRLTQTVLEAVCHRPPGRPLHRHSLGIPQG